MAHPKKPYFSRFFGADFEFVALYIMDVEIDIFHKNLKSYQ